MLVTAGWQGAPCMWEARVRAGRPQGEEEQAQVQVFRQLQAKQHPGHLGEIQVFKTKFRGWVVFQVATTGGLEWKNNMVSGLRPPHGGLADGVVASVGVGQMMWPFPCPAPYFSPPASPARRCRTVQSPSDTLLVKPRSYVKPKLEWNVGNVFQPLYHRKAI